MRYLITLTILCLMPGHLFADDSALIDQLFRQGDLTMDITASGLSPAGSPTYNVSAGGGEKLSSISYESCDRQFTDEIDLLLVHDGVIPNTWLAMSAGCRHHWHVQQRCWVPDITGVGQTSRQTVSVVGDAAGIIGADASVLQGEAVAREVIPCLEGKQQNAGGNTAHPLLVRQHRLLRRCLDQFYPPAQEFELPPDDETIVCRWK